MTNSSSLLDARGRLSIAVLDWSLQSIEAHADNDLFTRPFEFAIFRKNWQELASELLDLRVDMYRWSEPRRLLLPKDRVSFRQACQLDPLDSLLLTALGKLVGLQLERRRLPRDVVFSARVATDGDTLYDKGRGWESFWQCSRERAEAGAAFIARTDITDFYNQVPHAEVLGELEVSRVPERLRAAFANFLQAFSGRLGRGVPIGPHAGHLLAEVALTRIDALLSARGLKFNRYIDDYHIFCKTESDAQVALHDLAEELSRPEVGLTLNRLKTTITPLAEFVAEARLRSREDAASQVEQNLLDAIQMVTDGNYSSASFEKVLEITPDAVSEEAIETVLSDELLCERVDYPKVAWLLRRLSQVEAPGGVDFVLNHFDAFVPVIGDTARYLASAGGNWTNTWGRMGETILQHAEHPVAARNSYVQAVLIALFAEQRELNHIDVLLKRFAHASEAAQREIIRAAEAARATDWLHDLRHRAAKFDPWSRRAFIHALEVLSARQQEECLRSLGTDMKGAETILIGAVAERRRTDGEAMREPSGPAWAARLALVAAERRALVEERLEGLGHQLKTQVYGQDGDNRLLLATWNLRNFGGGGFGYSERLPESLLCIARVLMAFDLVALQEVRDKQVVDRLVTLLGPGWDKLICGEAPGHEGNSERSAFVFRTAAAKFLGEVEQVVLGKRDLVLGRHQFARAPFVVNFAIGGRGSEPAKAARITTCTAHTYYGADTGLKLRRRIAEIDALSKLVLSRAQRERSTAFLLGDLNVVGPGHATMAPLRKRQIALAEEHLVPTNAKGNKFYTQIAFQATHEGPRLRAAGVVPVFDHMFRPEDRSRYQTEMETSAAWDTHSRKVGARKRDSVDKFYDEWRTYQLSDHLPVWVALDV